MKICIVHSDPKLPARESIDLWRIIRPFAELEKHTDYKIDHRPYLIDDSLIDSDTNKIPTDKLVEEIVKLGKYDIVWTGYFPDATLFDAMLFTQEKFGTKFVLDVDDDFYNIPESNPMWRQEGDMEQNVADIQYAIENTPYLVTSCKNLYDWYVSKREGKTYILENYIGGYEHKPFDNGKNVVISFFGGVSHKADIEKSGFLEALKKIMKKYPHVHAGSVGLELKFTGTLKKRYTFNPGIPGQQYVTRLWPAINADIAVAPLEYNDFNRRKTNIKWQETALIPAAFVGTRIPPYFGTVENEKTGLLVREGADFWYDALERLVVDEEFRKTLANNAKAEVEKNWTIENNWHKLKEIIDDVTDNNSSGRTRQEIRPSRILTP